MKKIIELFGTLYYYENNLLHREDGPAIEWHSGAKSWWLKGELYGYNNDFTNQSWIRFVKTLIFY